MGEWQEGGYVTTYSEEAAAAGGQEAKTIVACSRHASFCSFVIDGLALVQVDLYIGCHANRRLGWVGAIRNLRYYEGVLTQEQMSKEAIEEQKTAPASTLAEGVKLLAHYPLAEAGIGSAKVNGAGG